MTTRVLMTINVETNFTPVIRLEADEFQISDLRFQRSDQDENRKNSVTRGFYRRIV